MKKLLTALLSITMAITCISMPLSASAASYIGTSRAKQIALSNASVKASKVKYSDVQLTTDDGVKVYDVEFRTALADYEYEINAKTGKIKDKDIDWNVRVILSHSTFVYNGKRKAPTVTIRKPNGDKISSSHYTVSYEDNVKPGKGIVRVKFNNKTYTGKFIHHFTIKPKVQKITSVSRKGSKLTIKWARDSVVSGYQIQYSTNSDFRNGKTIRFSSNKTTSKVITGVKSKKYYARIRAYKNYGRSRIYGKWSSKGVSSNKYIGMEKAKEIALKDAGLKKSEVRFVSAYVDVDDGIKVYDIEFTSSGWEYEYEINAKTGKIMDRSIDRI